MKFRSVLVTGGAGFIGSHLTDFLVQQGSHVRIYDNLDPRIHKSREMPSSRLNPKAEFLRGNMIDKDRLRESIEDMEAIVHLAAVVGANQSMRQIDGYISSNTLGTAVLLDLLVNEENSVRKLVVASSASIYGEGKYQCESCGVVYPSPRTESQIRSRDWELSCPSCGKKVVPLPISEAEPLKPLTVYAMTKRHQEELCLLIGKTYGVPTVALRFFNAYGPRQSPSSPYSGVCTMFIDQVLRHQPPTVYEDGRQTRDFVYVGDVAKAIQLALERQVADYQVYNVGSGKATSIGDLAENLLKIQNSSLAPRITQKGRVGDIRHSCADITKISRELGYEPEVQLLQGLTETVRWIESSV